MSTNATVKNMKTETELEQFARFILDSEYSDGYPTWVNVELFESEMLETITTLILNNFEKGDNVIESVDLEYSGVLCPFTSANVDIGASGGLDGKHSEKYKFPKALVRELKRKTVLEGEQGETEEKPRSGRQKKVKHVENKEEEDSDEDEEDIDEEDIDGEDSEKARVDENGDYIPRPYNRYIGEVVKSTIEVCRKLRN
jgi:hypothetical protein